MSSLAALPTAQVLPPSRARTAGTTRLQTWSSTWQGPRERNEDHLHTDPELGLAVVADGVGGHLAGGLASSQACVVIGSALRAREEDLGRIARDGYRDLRLAWHIERAVQQACGSIHERSLRDVRTRGMATTVTALLLAGPKAVMAHVGDTRLYLFRDGALHRLSQDHTVAEQRRNDPMLMDVGHPREEHILTRALGPHPRTPVDTLIFDALPGDVFVLCSDGVHGVFHSDEDLAFLCASTPPRDLAGALTELASARGGKDNATAVVAEVSLSAAADRAGETRRSTLVNLRLEILAACEPFRGMALPQMARLLEHVRSRPFGRAETVIREGAELDGLHLLIRGELRAEVRERVTTLTLGEVYGVAAAFTRDRARATVRGATDGELLVLSRARLERLLACDPRLGSRILERLGRYLAMTRGAPLI